MRPFLVLSLLWFILPAQSEGWRFARVRQEPGSFFTGLAVGIGAHEIAHVAVASSKGFHVALRDGSIVYPGAYMSNKDHLQVASAGFQAQWVLSEAVLRSHEEMKTTAPMGNFGAGIVSSHLVISAAYLLLLKNYGQSDLTGMAAASGCSRNTLTALMAVPAVLDYWRLTGNHVPGWVPQLSLCVKGISIGTVWNF